MRAFGHGAHAGTCPLDERRQQLRLGEVLPVTTGHLLPHHPGIEPCRVEDVRVVGAPQVFAGVLRGCVAGRAAGAEAQHLAIPQRARLGREDRPAHAGEPPREERRDALEDLVRRFEPGDEAVVLAGHLAEAHEGLHLVAVAANVLRPLHGLAHVGVGRHREQVPLTVRQSPQQAVEQRMSRRIAVAQHALGQPDERGGHPRRFAHGGRGLDVRRRQQTALPARLPVQVLRRDPSPQRRARDVAECVRRPRRIDPSGPPHRHRIIRTGRPGEASERVARAMRPDRQGAAAGGGRGSR